LLHASSRVIGGVVSAFDDDEATLDTARMFLRRA
jgi:hypothetical protein